MIPFAAGDAWAWNVDLRYSDAEGILLHDRERWSVRVEKGGAFTAERAFLGTVVGDGEMIPSADPKPERLKGRVDSDGTLNLKDLPSDPVAARIFRRLLNPDRVLNDRLPGLPLVRRALFREPEARLPGSGLPASLRVEAKLISVRLAGKELPLRDGSPWSEARAEGGTAGEGVTRRDDKIIFKATSEAALGDLAWSPSQIFAKTRRRKGRLTELLFEIGSIGRLCPSPTVPLSFLKGSHL